MTPRLRSPGESSEEAFAGPLTLLTNPRRARSDKGEWAEKRAVSDNRPSPRGFVDPRQPWVGPHHTLKWRYMHSFPRPQPLPQKELHSPEPLMSPGLRSTSNTSLNRLLRNHSPGRSGPENPSPGRVDSSACLGGAMAMLFDCLAGISKKARSTGCKASERESKAPRRWYRVQPVNDICFSVRADPGVKGQIPEVVNNAFPGQLEEPETRLFRSQRWRRSLSVPDFVERSMGLPAPGFQCDAFRDCCRICFDNAVEVVALPCRHGGLCESCMRRSLFSRPRHRGGRICPFCRRGIGEVIRICREAMLPQYGYTIAIG